MYVNRFRAPEAKILHINFLDTFNIDWHGYSIEFMDVWQWKSNDCYSFVCCQIAKKHLPDDEVAFALVRLSADGSYADADVYHFFGAADILGNAFDDHRSRYSGYAIDGDVRSTPTHGNHDVVSSNLSGNAGASTYGHIQDGRISVTCWSSPHDVRATGVCNAFDCAAADVDPTDVNIAGCTADAIHCTSHSLATTRAAAHALDASGRSRR